MHPKRIGIRGLKSSHSNKNGNSALACGEEKKRKDFADQTGRHQMGIEYGQRNDRQKLIPNATETPIKRWYIGSTGREKAKLVDERPSDRISAAL